MSYDPPIDTSGETASSSQFLLKGPVVRACWCAIGVEPRVCPCANNDHEFTDEEENYSSLEYVFL
jgi:hypothetical protein